jgi:A/G-specific adenine glycosylase
LLLVDECSRVVTIGSLKMKKPAGEQDSSAIGALRTALLKWYARHKRALPWRRDRDAYRVWVSEIMLQQTRVAAVLEHYHAFLKAFPGLEALAEAPLEQVLACWSGLGYYRRARMLHQAAGVVVNDRGGVIPRTAEELRTLPGVGRYTAAAIASIAYGEAVAVVDGNVERVLSRLDGEPRSGSAAWKRAQELLDRRHSGDWNQALMELGATLCTPQKPQCLVCPLRSWCRAPGAETSRARPARRRVQSVRGLIERNMERQHCVYLVQRPADASKMAGMWELPECALPASPHSKELCVVRHSITDTDYEVRVLRMGVRALGKEQRQAGRWVERHNVFELPLTGLTRKILRTQGFRPAYPESN